MMENLLIGAALVCITVLIHMLGIMALNSAALTVTRRFKMDGRPRRVVAMLGVVLGLFGVATVEIWMWAGCFSLVGATSDFPSALYLSTITYSTVGYGDIVPQPEWRLLAAMEGITGFLMIGWSTAFLVTAGTRIGPFKSGEHF